MTKTKSTTKRPGKRVYRITFFNQGTLYEVYAKQVNQGELFGFIELKELVFGNHSLVVDPAEERLKNEFSGVRTTYIPMHSILRIDEVEKEGIGKIREITTKHSNNVALFPGPIYTPTSTVE